MGESLFHTLLQLRQIQATTDTENIGKPAQSAKPLEIHTGTLAKDPLGQLPKAFDRILALSNCKGKLDRNRPLLQILQRGEQARLSRPKLLLVSVGHR